MEAVKQPPKPEWTRDGGYVRGPEGAYIYCMGPEQRSEDVKTAQKITQAMNAHPVLLAAVYCAFADRR